MAANRYPDNSRYPRDRSPPYRDRRPSNFGGAYLPRGNELNNRPNPEPSAFPPRDPPRGPKSLGDAPRGPAAGPPSSAPSAPRDGRGRGFAGRGEDTPLRTAPPLSSGPAANSHNSWRADRERERDRDFDRRERRPTPPRRSPVRESRDPRDQRDFGPRDVDVNRARRNSRDGPPSAGSTYSDPPLGSGSTYRGGGLGRGRGGREFAGRGRPPFHADERERHHDPRDRPWRPRSRSPPPIRRERDVRDERRDERDLDRRDRDDRRFEPRAYDSYIGPAGSTKSGLRPLDTHRGPGSSESRYMPGTPTGPTPHPHHTSPSDRLGPQMDSYPRRSSLAIDPTTAKELRRDPGKDDALLASRAEASRERYAPRASSPPAAVPAFGSNVWRAPALDAKSSTVAVPPKPVVPVSSTSVNQALPPVSAAPTIPTTSKPSIPPSHPAVPPTGPKADRAIDRPSTDSATPENRTALAPLRMEPSLSQRPTVPPPVAKSLGLEKVEQRGPVPQLKTVPTVTSSATPLAPLVPTGPSASSALQASSVPARSPPHGPAAKPRPPPIAPQAAFRPNASPQFSRSPFPPYVPQDASPGAALTAIGPRSGNGGASSVNTSPKSLPSNIPTGPKADRASMAPRPPSMYPPSDRPVFDRPGFDRPGFDRPAFSTPRAPISGGPKSMQWVRPGLMPNRLTVPSKREFPNDDRDRTFGTPPKAPRLESNTTTSLLQRTQQAKSESPSFNKAVTEPEKRKERASSAERPVAQSPKSNSLETRRHSDVFMADTSPRIAKPPISGASSVVEVLQDSDDDLDLDEGDFAGSEAKYKREKELLEAKKIDLSAPQYRGTSPLQEIVMLSCLTINHLPSTIAQPEQMLAEENISMQEAAPSHHETGSVHQPTVSPPLVQPSESITTELLTPKNEDMEEINAEEKAERVLAPATAALRLRRETSAELDAMPDLSTLPYLGSGPPTPLSDIGHNRPKLPEAVMLAIRDKLRKSIEPVLSTEETLQQYADVYREWRLNIRPLDDEHEQEEQERQPSLEPSLKATTPDVSTAAMTGLLDAPLTVSSRRGHSSRWATELDLEQALKESLKTAEEERMGKKDKEPRRALADPEKEADLPLELVESEAQRRRYIDTNFQREPGQGIFVFHYEPPEDDFTEEEHRVMVQNYRDQYAKKWGKLAEILYKEVGTERTYKDCINHYYATKWRREYKGKARGRKGGRAKRGGAVGRGRGAIANMDRPDIPGEDGTPLPLTETGRPRRSAAPTFGGMETDFDPTAATPTPGRARRTTDADVTQEKGGRRTKMAKEKGSRKAKNMPLAAAPAGSPVRVDRKEKGSGVKSEDEFGKRSLGEMSLPMSLQTPTPVHPGLIDEQVLLSGEPFPGMGLSFMDRPKNQASARPGPSSYWSVSELQDFDRNVAHFGTDWIAIANHMGTKTHTMIKNQYLRLLETGRMDLEHVAKEADLRRDRGEMLGPPPTPTPAPKRRYESTQTALPRQIAPTPELHNSPLLNSLALPKTTPPHSTPSTRFSTITQAPMQSKPLVSATGFPPISDTDLASITSIAPRQSPPVPPQRNQSQHHHTASQHRSQHPGPRAGYFSDEAPPRVERPPSQSSQQPSRPLQQHVPPSARNQESHQPHPYHGFGHNQRETLNRSDVQQDHDTQHRYEQHARRISQEMHHHRPFGGTGLPSLGAPIRSSSDARSPEHRSLPYTHSRQPSQNQPFSQPPPDMQPQPHHSHSGPQQMPSRSEILTPPVKEEPRSAPVSAITQAQVQPYMQAQHPIHSQYSAPPVQSATAHLPKPTAEPRKSNLMSLLNDAEPDEPRRKKHTDHGPSSHNTTPQQQTPIAPPPPPVTTQAAPSRRGLYDDLAYGRPSYAQQSSLPPTTSNRTIDLTHEQPYGGRSNVRESWQQRHQFHPSQSQAPPSAPIPSSHAAGLPPSSFSDSNQFRNHRSVFAQHNGPRHNPSPPPHSAYNDSPHLQSRTPSISGPSRHAMPSTTVAHHPGTPGASALILQPNPYAQVDPPGTSAPPTGPMGMRPSPHLHTSHIVQQRESSSRNELSQTQNANLPFSNPQTPNEHSGHQSSRGPSNLPESYRPRDLRELHQDYDSRHPSDRDTGRELSQRADLLREKLANPALRSGPSHDDLRYQAQRHDRSYFPQRSHTPLSRSEHNQPPPLQHPPHSSLGANNHSLYGQRAPEEPSHRPFQPFNPRDRSLTERLREEQAQQQAMTHEDFTRREDEQRQLRDRELRDVHMRESLLRRDMRGPPPPGSAPGPVQDQRLPSAPGSMDWTSALRHQQDRPGWQR
jgi:serine/arginine repetitive matrix protein 2